MPNTTWLDVTTILGWQRSAVGIIRTEVECAKFCMARLSDGAAIKFCLFSPTEGYREVEPQVVAATIERISGVVKKASPISAENINKPTESVEVRVKKKVFKLLSLLPGGLQRRIFTFLVPRKPAAINLITSLRYLKLSLKLWVKPVGNHYLPLMPSGLQGVSEKRTDPFNTGDRYISLGLDWDQKDFSYLYSVKKDKNLHVSLFCYDVIPVKLPHLCVGDVSGKFAHYFSNVAWCADEVFCISQCSKRDLATLLTELGTPVPKLTVIELGCELPVLDETAAISPDVAALIGTRFILFVSTIERRKNHEVLYKAYTRLIDNNVANVPPLVFVGMQGWGMNDFISDLKLDPRVKDKIIILNNVSDPDLIRLYRNCWFTVYPSLYEGWGLPVAESLAFGKYCLASKAASIPEVGKELLDYLDPWDVPEWESKIQHFIEHPQELMDKEKLIKETFVPMNWRESARSIIDV